MTTTQGILIIAGVAAAAGLVWLASSRMAAEAARAAEIDRGIVDEYCRLVAEGRYEEAWDRCLTARYRGSVTREDFVVAHRRRREKVGVLQGRRLVDTQTSRNLFSREKEIRLLYALQYPGGERRDTLSVSDADGEFRVDGTYTSSASDSLDFVIW